MGELLERKAKRERGLTNKEILKEATKTIEPQDTMVVAYLKDGRVHVEYSIESTMETIAMLEIAKQEIMESMIE